MTKSKTKSDATNATKNDLPPWQIDLSKITDENERNIAQETIDQWIQNLQKDVSDLFTKNGLRVYQISFLHEGTKTPILLSKGSNFLCCRLAAYGHKALKDQVDKELTLES